MSSPSLTETITIEAVWDEGYLRLERLLLNGMPVPPNMWVRHSSIMLKADELAEAIGHWQLYEAKRNVSE